MVDPEKIREWIDVLERSNSDTVDSEVLEATSILMGDLLIAYEAAIEKKEAFEDKTNKFLVNRMVLRTITMTKWLQEHHPHTLIAWSKYADTLPPLPKVAGPWACPQCGGYLMTSDHLCSCDYMNPPDPSRTKAGYSDGDARISLREEGGTPSPSEPEPETREIKCPHCNNEIIISAHDDPGDDFMIPYCHHCDRFIGDDSEPEPKAEEKEDYKS